MLLAMSQKELKRVDVIRDICEKRLTQIDASRLLNLTRRHIQRLVNQYRDKGASGLVSLRRGQPSNRQFPPDFKRKTLDIIKDKYADFGPTFANEKLFEKHNIKLSSETLRHWMIDKLRQVNQAAIVDNKRLGAALAFAKRSQDERSGIEAHKRLVERHKKEPAKSIQYCSTQ